MSWALYKQHPAFVLAFHGCDAAVGQAVLRGDQDLAISTNDYDWLGEGVYFWEGSPARALEFAQARKSGSKASKGKIAQPFVIGALVDLGHCCNLVDSEALDELKLAHESFEAAWRSNFGEDKALPVNDGGSDRVRRKLDQATIMFMHGMRAESGLTSYDTVRAAFFEGDELYPGAGFSARAHVQIAVRNLDCIKGYFLPRQRVAK